MHKHTTSEQQPNTLPLTPTSKHARQQSMKGTLLTDTNMDTSTHNRDSSTQNQHPTNESKTLRKHEGGSLGYPITHHLLPTTKRADAGSFSGPGAAQAT